MAIKSPISFRLIVLLRYFDSIGRVTSVADVVVTKDINTTIFIPVDVIGRFFTKNAGPVNSLVEKYRVAAAVEDVAAVLVAVRKAP